MKISSLPTEHNCRLEIKMNQENVAKLAEVLKPKINEYNSLLGILQATTIFSLPITWEIKNTDLVALNIYLSLGTENRQSSITEKKNIKT